MLIVVALEHGQPGLVLAAGVLLPRLAPVLEVRHPRPASHVLTLLMSGKAPLQVGPQRQAEAMFSPCSVPARHRAWVLFSAGCPGVWDLGMD